MKKAYQKPQMIVEDFVVSDYFANCGSSFQFGASCSAPNGMKQWVWEGIKQSYTIFVETPQHCAEGTSRVSQVVFDQIFSPQNDNICYFTATGTAVIGS